MSKKAKEYKAIIKASGKEVVVYKHRYRKTYVNSADCTTEYNTEDLQILGEI